MNKELIYVIGQMATEKGIDKEILFEALESALLSASKKTMGVADNTRMELDRHTGVLKVFARKKVVEAVADPKLEIALTEARKLNAEAELEDEIEIGLPTQEFGRIAAQTAKQVILQRVRDAERDAVYSDFIDKQGKIIRGTVHRIEKRNVIVDLGKAEAVITEREQIPGERYNPNDRVRAFVQEVKKTSKGPQILLSRADAGFLVRLFEAEIPEIAEGIVQVKAAAREPGERAKVAVMSTKRDIDPIGACVGLRGTRIQVISRELRSEKIDIVEWAPDPATFVARALSPAKVSSVTLGPADESGEPRAAMVIVPDNQLSLAIAARGAERAPRGQADRAARGHQKRRRSRGGTPPRGGGAGPRPGGARGVPGRRPAADRAARGARSFFAGAHRPCRDRGPRGSARSRRKEGGGDLRRRAGVDRAAPARGSCA